MQTILCGKCGKKAEDNDKFCRKCGALLMIDSIVLNVGTPTFENKMEHNILNVIVDDLKPLYPEETFRIEKTCESYTTLFFDEYALCRLEWSAYHTIKILMCGKVMHEKYKDNPLFTFNDYNKPTATFFMSFIKSNDLDIYHDILVEACDNILLNIEKQKKKEEKKKD